MSLPDTARRVSDVAAAQGAVRARATNPDLPMTERVAELLGEQRGERTDTDRAGATHAEPRPERR
jgi:hypothetical protein